MEKLFEQGQPGIPGQMGEHYPKGPIVEQPQAQPQSQEGGAPAEFGEEPVTAEEQAQYERFVTRALQYMASDSGNIIRRMNNKEIPIYQSVGRQGLMIAEMVMKLAESSGQPLDMNIVQAGGEEIVEGLMEMGDAAGIWPFSADSDEYEEAMVMGYTYGHELKAKELIEKGDPAVKESAENLLAGQIAKEREAGMVPDEFFDNIAGARDESSRRKVYGVD